MSNFLIFLKYDLNMKKILSTIIFFSFILIVTQVNAQKDSLNLANKSISKGIKLYPNNVLKQQVFSYWYLLWGDFFKNKEHGEALSKYMQANSWRSYTTNIHFIIHFDNSGQILKISFSKNTHSVLVNSIDIIARKSFSELAQKTNISHTMKNKKILFGTSIHWNNSEKTSTVNYVDNGSESLVFNGEDMIIDNIIIAPFNQISSIY